MQDIDGNTQLHLSAINGNLDAVIDLLDQGADVDLKNNCGQSAWFLALKNFNIGCFIIIMWHKIKLIIKNTFFNSSTNLDVIEVKCNQVPDVSEVISNKPLVHISSNTVKIENSFNIPTL